MGSSGAKCQFVVIERGQQDDDPDDILDVRIFGNEAEALAYATTLQERSYAAWNVDKAWRDKDCAIRGRLFDEIVRPHLYRPTEEEARAKLIAMVHDEIGERPGLDGMCGMLDVFRCCPGEEAVMVDGPADPCKVARNA